MKVLNEIGEVVELPNKSFPVCGHVHPGASVKRNNHTRLQCGFWGQAPGPSGYYHAYFWDAASQQAYFEIGCPHSASHMPNPDIATQTLRVEQARETLRQEESLLVTLQTLSNPDLCRKAMATE